ncbi:MAG: beta-galactosidase [Clostridiales bacterium]|nr:beta-galactosidase [Clostridiales bacterium]
MFHKDHMLFGAAYYDEYMPYDRIDKDFELMKQAGMNVIRIAESTWSTWEPEDGVFDFGKLHIMLSKAREYGLSVIIGTPTYAIPSWLALKYPHILAETASGRHLYGHRQLTDITDPDYLRYAERIIRRLMEECRSYDNIIGVQLDNETRSADAASAATQALFVAQMMKKYPDIEDFNREFGLDYWSNRIARWEDFPDIRGTINGSLSAAYKYFLRNVITEFLDWQSKIVREYMSDDVFITHNFDFSWVDYSYGIQPLVNQQDAARCMDVAGVDIYHLSQDRFDGSTIAFGGSVGRSLKKDNYLVLETQAQGRANWVPYPGQLRLSAYSHLASGSNSVMYWHWHSIHNSFETYWKGILSHDLQPNEIYRELSIFGNEMRSIESHLINLSKTPPVAILVDNRSLTGLDEFPCDDTDPDTPDYNKILRTFCDALYKLNIEYDLVYKDDPIAKYSLVLVPALYSATEDTIARLKDYVKGGGRLLATFKSFFADEEIKVYHDLQPHNMTDCLGLSYQLFTVPRDVTVTIDGKSHKAQGFMELVTADQADTIAYYDHPMWGKYSAVTSHKYGNGKAYYLATLLDQGGLTALLRVLLPECGISLPEQVFPLIIKSGLNGLGRKISYMFNYSSSPVSGAVTESGTDLISGRCFVTGDKYEIAPWDLMILEA